MAPYRTTDITLDWDDFDQFVPIINKYIPIVGEGDTMASQAATAVNRLVYKWFNDGDVFDNVMGGMQGWANDLSSEANWLLKHCPERGAEILFDISKCFIDSDYTDMLFRLAQAIIDPEYLKGLAEQQKVDSIYECEGPFRFEEGMDEDMDEEEEW